MTPEFRRDPLHDTWVAFAPKRQRRPSGIWAARPKFQQGHGPIHSRLRKRAADAQRGLCIAGGKLARQRARLARARGSQSLSRNGDRRSTYRRSPLDRTITSLGSVRMKSWLKRQTNGGWRTLPVSPSISEVLVAWRERINDLDRDTRFQHIYIFKNVGAAAGASLAHAHSQIVALPVIPPLIEGKLKRARAHYEEKQRSLFRRHPSYRARRWLAASSRKTTALFSFVRTRAAFPFELAIFPKRHHPDYASCGGPELQDLAEVLRFALQRVSSDAAKARLQPVAAHRAPLRRRSTDRLRKHARRLLLAHGNYSALQPPCRIRSRPWLVHQHGIPRGSGAIFARERRRNECRHFMAHASALLCQSVDEKGEDAVGAAACGQGLPRHDRPRDGESRTCASRSISRRCWCARFSSW